MSTVAADERDLGAMLQRLLTEVLARERPLLAARNLPMWDYVALVRLEEQAAPTQAQLAAAMGRDRTRVIESIDRLEATGLINRSPDPADRRNRIVSLTPTGRRTLAAVRRDIRAMERELLSPLDATDREALIGALRQLDKPPA